MCSNATVNGGPSDENTASMEVHAFLKQRGVYLHYDLGDLEQDPGTAQSRREKLQDQEVPAKRPSE